MDPLSDPNFGLEDVGLDHSTGHARDPARISAPIRNNGVSESGGATTYIPSDAQPRASSSGTAALPHSDAPRPSASSGFSEVHFSSPKLQARAVADGQDPIHNPDLVIVVSDPQKQGDGMQAYVTYKIQTKTTFPQFRWGEFSVHRRYKDFVWLHQNLVERHQGVLIPPLPEKLVVDFTKRFSKEFIEARRKGLEKFLQRVASHPALNKSPELKAFLEDNEEAWVNRMAGAAAPLPQPTDGPSASSSAAAAGKKPRDYAWVFNQMASAVTNLASGNRSTTPTISDSAFEDTKRYVASFDNQLSDARRLASRLVEKHRELAVVFAELGLSFVLLGNLEGDSLGRAISAIGSCADRLSMLTHQSADRESDHLDELLKDYLRIAGAVREVVKLRQAALQALQAAYTDHESKRARLLKAKDAAARGGRDDRVLAWEKETEEAKREWDRAKAEYERLSASMRAEMERLQQQKLFDFKKSLAAFATAQIDTCRQVEAAWRSVLPEIDAISLVPGRTPGQPPASAGSVGSRTPAIPTPGRARVEEDYFERGSV
eukprot:tig00001443_g8747.t1